MANHVRLSKGEIESIIEMTKDGKSLREISRLVGKGKTTVYYYYKRLKPRRSKPFMMTLDEGQIGEIIGAFAGDGSYYVSRYKNCVHHKVSYSFSSEKEVAYKNYIVSLLKQLNLNPFMVHHKRKCIIVVVNSRDFANYIIKYLAWEPRRSHTVRIKESLSCYSLDFLRGFARGIMDTECHVSNYNIITACTSEKLIDNLAEILDIFRIAYSRKIISRGAPRKDLHKITIFRRSLEDYRLSIGFSNESKKIKLQKVLNGVARI